EEGSHLPPSIAEGPRHVPRRRRPPRVLATRRRPQPRNREAVRRAWLARVLCAGSVRAVEAGGVARRVPRHLDCVTVARCEDEFARAIYACAPREFPQSSPLAKQKRIDW